MGNPVSKLMKNSASESREAEVKNVSPSTPTRSISINQNQFDPRSPSIEIARTPIEKNILEQHQLECTPQHKNFDETTKCFEELQTDLDPRSPTVEISRTPIIVKSLQNKLRQQLDETPKQSDFQETTDYRAQVESDLDPRSPTVEISRTPITVQNPVVQIKNTDDIRRKLLKGNTIKKVTQSTEDILLATRKQGVLETDLDFIETDIDLVYHNKTTKYLQNIQDNPLNIETGYLLNLEDPRSPSCGIDRTPIQVPKQVSPDPRSPTLDFIRTPILLVSTDDSIEIESFEEKLESLTLQEETIEPVLDTLLTTVAVVTPKVQKGLIYEDNVNDSPTVTPSRKVNVDGRTPLGVRNGSQLRSKSANGRLLQNNVLKNEYGVGKIPIYNKNIKKLKGAKKVKQDVNGQCENTPPRKNKKRTGSAHQWDATDNTMII